MSLTSGTEDDGYVFLSYNGQIQETWHLGPGDVDEYGQAPNGWLGANIEDNAGVAGWGVSTSDNVLIRVTAGGETAGTYAGFANSVTAYRGGADGSVDMKLDGPVGGSDAAVYIAMPTNGELNIGNATADTDLPNSPDGKQPYFTITGPNTIALDQADSRPDLGYTVYTLPAGDATITYHMVAPYWDADYNDGIYVSVLSQQPASNVIPISASWWEGSTNVFWEANGGPPAKGMAILPHAVYDPATYTFSDANDATRISDDFHIMLNTPIGAGYGMMGTGQYTTQQRLAAVADLDAMLTAHHNSMYDYDLIRSGSYDVSGLGRGSTTRTFSDHSEI